MRRRLAGVEEFLERHPEFAVAFADVTAAAGRAVYGDITMAGRELCETASETGERKRVRDAAEKHLRWRMRGTVIMLSAVLEKAIRAGWRLA